MNRIIAAAAVAAFAAGAAWAQPAPTVVRGTVTSLAGNVLVVKSEAGPAQTVQLAPNWSVSVLKPVPMSAIKPGSFIGTAEIPQADGKGKSIEVHVFPPGVKMGEGHYAWDLRPGSMMTNGTVGTVKRSLRGRELQVSYPNGTRTVRVPGSAPVNQITNGTRDQIRPGVPVFMVVRKSPNGSLAASSISIGENGRKPPM